MPARLGPPRRAYHVAAALLLGLFCALLYTSAQHESITVDEPLHLTRGLAFWWTGDTRLSYPHPPLGNALEALPEAFSPPTTDLTSLPGWKTADYKKVEQAYFEHNFPAARRQIARGRVVVMALAALLGIYLYVFCAARWGPVTALAALFLYCLHPTLIAHARLCTTDMPVTVFSTVALCELVRYLERPRILPLFTTSLALGAALATKYSAIFLVPFMLLAGGTYGLLGKGRFAGQPLGARVDRFATHALVTAVIALLSVNAAYRFQRTDWTVTQILREPEPQDHVSARYHNKLLERRTFLPKLPNDLPIPLPYSYVFGASTVHVLDEGGSHGYFFGEARRGSAFYYFPVLIAIKSPASVIALLAAGAAILWRRRRLSRPTKVLAFAAALYLALAMRSDFALGVRHVLSILPILSLLAARAWARIDALGRPFASRAALGVVLCSGVGALCAYPHYLGYFNVLCGGERTGHWISMVGEDWGQDVEDLGAYIQSGDRQPFYYVSFSTTPGSLELDAMDVPHKRLGCKDRPAESGAYVALHGCMAVRDKGCYPWMTDAELVHTVNHHILVYRTTSAGTGAPPPADSDEPEDPDTPTPPPP